jgi:glycosyltransferase involved in cell wall biosynthesis
LLTADTAGGVWTYAVELARELERRGVEVVIAARGLEPRPTEGLDVHFLRSKLEWMDDPWDDLAAGAEWLLDLRDEVEPDVVHASGYGEAALPWGVPIVCVSHSDVLSWFEAVRGEPAPGEWSLYRELVEAGLAAADVVVSPTRAQLASLERLYGFDGARLVIPNGRRPLRPRPKRRLIAAAGRAWDEAKGLEALARVDAGWPIEIADGSRSDAEVEALLARAAIFAEPARYEPFGLAAVEAASAGAALVLGDIPSLREVWADAAVYVSDERELERALTRLVRNEQLRDDYALRARRRALRYSPERMAAGYLALYTRLTARVAA